jgi:hypothetical protein
MWFDDLESVNPVSFAFPVYRRGNTSRTDDQPRTRIGLR